MIGLRISLLFIVTILLSTATFGQLSSTKAASDQRVKKALDQAGLKYQIDGDGDFKLTMEVTDGRTQLVFVNSDTEYYGEFEIREVWSVAYQSSAAFTATVSNVLLMYNTQTKLGAWQISKVGGKNSAVYCAKVSAAMSGAEIKSVIKAVSSSADEIEQKLTSGDDF